jgi:hypothetical protein
MPSPGTRSYPFLASAIASAESFNALASIAACWAWDACAEASFLGFSGKEAEISGHFW